MRSRHLVGAVALALMASSCLGGGGEQRTIRVDFSHDEFASFFLFNFPKKVKVRQGTELVFRQTWTGEPHTVTGGSVVTDSLGDSEKWDRFFSAFDGLMGVGVQLPNPEAPGDATMADVAKAIEEAEPSDEVAEFVEAYDAIRASGVPFPDLDDPGDMSFEDFVVLVDTESTPEGLPWAMDEDEDGAFVVTQNAGQPCYLSEGSPPEDADTPCADAEQEQPVFDGTHSYYNSGIIPFEGPAGNTYRVQLSDEIEPGTYRFYCAVHGPGQLTEVEVVDAATEAPSEEEIAREARREIDELSEGPQRLYRQAVSEGAIEIGDQRIEGPFAGLFDPSEGHVAINEFVPKQRTVNAGDPITWKMMGADHTITFDVPPYFPIVEFLDDGTVRLNPKLAPTAGGAVPAPEQEGEGVFEVDGGSWDGEGFWSSGLVSAEPYLDYTMRITKPGTYKYACLLHPPMVGTIVVT